jgi:hypothetical protein
MKTLLAILLFALPAQAISTDSFWFYSQCPAQYASCAQEVLYAQTAHKALCYLIRYEGGVAIDIKGITEEMARNGGYTTEEECLTKTQACHDWLLEVEKHNAAGKVTYFQQSQVR